MFYTFDWQTPIAGCYLKHCHEYHQDNFLKRLPTLYQVKYFFVESMLVWRAHNFQIPLNSNWFHRNIQSNWKQKRFWAHLSHNSTTSPFPTVIANKFSKALVHQPSLQFIILFFCNEIFLNFIIYFHYNWQYNDCFLYVCKFCWKRM